MGLFDFFIRRKLRTAKRRRSKGCGIPVKQQIAGIKGQVDSINSVLQKHQKDIDENSVILKEYGQKLKNLEDILTNQPIDLPLRQTSPTQRPDWTAKPVQLNGIHSCKFDINRFSNLLSLLAWILSISTKKPISGSFKGGKPAVTRPILQSLSSYYQRLSTAKRDR